MTSVKATLSLTHPRTFKRQYNLVVDIGAGSGALAKALLFEAHINDLVSIDISGELLKSSDLKQYLPHLVNLHLVANDINRLYNIPEADLVVMDPPFN